MKNIAKAIVLTAGVILVSTTTACSAPEFSHYTGTVTINSVAPSKYACVVNVKQDNGSSTMMNLGSASNCFGLFIGQKANMVDGKLTK